MEEGLPFYDYAPMVTHPEERTEAIAARLILLRKALGGDGHGSQVRFTAQVGLTSNAWNNLEKGRNRISIDTALTVAKATGVSLDWIYRGGDAEYRLPADLLEKFRRVREEESPEPAAKKA